MVLASLHSLYWQGAEAPAPSGHGGATIHSHKRRPLQRLVELFKEEKIEEEPFQITFRIRPILTGQLSLLAKLGAKHERKKRIKTKIRAITYKGINLKLGAKPFAIKPIITIAVRAGNYLTQAVKFRVKAEAITKGKFKKVLVARADDTISIIEKTVALCGQILKRDLRSPRRSSHQRSITTRETMKLEDRLNNKLIFYVNQIKNRLKNGITLNQIREEFKDRIRNDIKQVVQQAYMLGLDFTTKLDEAITLNQHDIDEMNELIRQYEDDFWLNVNEVYTNTEPDQDISLIVGIIAAAITFGTLSVVTREKVKEFNIKQPPTRTEREIELYWMSERDERVCPICQNLDGSIVKDDEQFFSALPPKIGGRISRYLNGPPAHPRCRCRILPWYHNKVVIG